MKSVQELSCRTALITNQEQANHIMAWMKHLGKIQYPGCTVIEWRPDFGGIFFAHNKTSFDSYMWIGTESSSMSFDDLYEYGMPKMVTDVIRQNPVKLEYIQNYVFIAETSQDAKEIFDILDDLRESNSRLYTPDFYYRYVVCQNGQWSLSKDANSGSKLAEFATLTSLRTAYGNRPKTVVSSSTTNQINIPRVKSHLDLSCTYVELNCKEEADHVEKWLESVGRKKTDNWNISKKNLFLMKPNEGYLFTNTPTKDGISGDFTLNDLCAYGMPAYHSPIPAPQKPAPAPKLDDEVLLFDVRVSGRQMIKNSIINNLARDAYKKGYQAKAIFRDLVNNGDCTIADNPIYTYYCDTECMYVSVKHDVHKTQRIYETGTWAAITGALAKAKPDPLYMSSLRIGDYVKVISGISGKYSPDSEIFIGKVLKVSRIEICDKDRYILGYEDDYPELKKKNKIGGGIWVRELTYATDDEVKASLNSKEYKPVLITSVKDYVDSAIGNATGLAMDSDGITYGKGAWTQLDKAYKVKTGDEAINRILAPNVEFIQPNNDEFTKIDTNVPRLRTIFELQQSKESIYF